MVIHSVTALALYPLFRAPGPSTAGYIDSRIDPPALVAFSTPCGSILGNESRLIRRTGTFGIRSAGGCRIH